MAGDSVFTKIIKGELPCLKVYEDAKTLAFLTTGPYLPGHTLVIPKVQVENFDDLELADYTAVFRTVYVVAKRLKAAFGVDKVAVLVMGFEVPHAHIHLVPVTDHKLFLDAMSAHIAKKQPYPYVPSPEELQLVADKINREDL